MSYLHRVLGCLTCLCGASLLLLGGTEVMPLSSAFGQGKDLVQPLPGPPLPGEPPTPTTVTKSDAFTLPLDRTAKQKLEAAEDYLTDESWKEAARLIQAVLDLKEDSFFLLPADAKKRLPERWTSTRAEAERLLASLPPAGKEFYQLTNEPIAQKMVKDANAARTPQLLAEIVRRFRFTSSGADALEQLGTYYLDRGQPGLAALAFQHRLDRGGHEPLAALTLFKALLAFRAAGDTAREQDTWNALGKHLDRGGLRIGTRVLTAEQCAAAVAAVARGLPSLAGETPLYRGDLARSGRGSGEMPYLAAGRRLPLTELEEGREWLQKAAEGAPANAVPLPGFVPLAFGDKLIYRSHVGVHAFDLRAEKELWRTPSALSLDSALRDSGMKVQLTQWFNLYHSTRNVLLENTITGTLSSDGKRIYAVEDLALPPPPDLIAQMQGGIPRYFGPFTDMAHPAKMHNKLRVLSAETGAVEWEVGGSDPKKTPPELLGTLFLGPPLPLGNSLFVVIEQRQDVRLLCLRADRGEVQWAQSLGVPRDKIMLDLPRRTQAVPLAYADGILVCPTGAGAVIAVDPLSRSLLWAHNYRDRPQAPLDPNQFVPEYNLDALQNCWKHCAPVIVEGRVVFTAPDSDSVRCLDLHTGALVWKASRTEEDLYLGTVSRGKVLLVGKNTCRALSLGNGGALWQQQTGRPAGEGALAGKTYYVPLKQGAIAALDLDNPRDSSRIEARGGATVGNLLFHDGVLWSQTVSDLTAFPQLTAQLERAEARVRDHDDADARLERGELRLDRGDLLGAIGDLHQALAGKPASERTRRELYDALTQLLQRDFNAGEKYLAEYRTLGQIAIPADATPAERQRLQHEQLHQRTRTYMLLAQGRERQGRLVEAVQAYRELVERTPVGERLKLLDDPGVEVRVDVWAQSQIGALVQRAAPEAAGQLQAYLDREWQTLATSSGLEAVERYAALFGAIPGPLGATGREARLRLAEQLAESAQRRLAAPTELELLALQQAADRPAFAARALHARARLLTRQGLLDDALAVYRTLAGDYPQFKLPDGHTPTALLDDLNTDKRFLAVLQEARPAWQGRKMKAKEIANGGIPMTYSALSVEFVGHAQPSTQRWRFLLDAQKWRLRVLDRDTMLENWSVPVPPMDFRRYGFDSEMFRARLLNHIAILNLGTSLVAVDLLERRVRWTFNLLDEPFGFNRGFNFSQDGSILVYSNEGRILYKAGLVGPVTPTGITVQTRLGLLGLDLADGTVRWQRADVPPGMEVFGDEQHLYLADYQNDGTVRGVRAVRAADGVSVPIPDSADVFAQKIRTLGHHVLASDFGAKEELTLRLFDIHKGKDVWRKTFPKDSLLLDSTLLDLAAVVTPQGAVTVFELRTGKAVTKLSIAPQHMEKVTKATLLRDAANYYIALVGPNDPQSRNLDNGQTNYFGDLRFAPINGMFYAFDRTTGEVKIANRAMNQMILLNRFDELPVVLFTTLVVRELGPMGSGQQISYLCTLSMDKQTGKRLFHKETPNSGDLYHTLYVEPRSGIVDLIANGSRLRHQVAAK